MSIHRFLLSDFVSVQRQSFFELLEKGLIEEFAKRNPILNKNNKNSFFFYPEYYILTQPQYKPTEAILKNKSYTSKLFVPVQITNKTQKQVVLKWVYIGNIPLMTKRGHFILNGAARVIVNQILRSPGIYYQEKIYENYEDNKGSKPKSNIDNTSTSLKDPGTKNEGIPLQPENSYKRYYCDLICMRGSWLRIEMDKEKNIWAQMKKGPKIPIYWFLLAMGLSEKVILKSIPDFQKVLGNLEKNQMKPKKKIYNVNFLSSPFSKKTGGETLVAETSFPSQKEKSLKNNIFGEVTHLPVSGEEHYMSDNKVSSTLFSDSVFSEDGKPSVAVFGEHGMPPPPKLPLRGSSGGRETKGFSTVPFSTKTGVSPFSLKKATVAVFGEHGVPPPPFGGRKTKGFSTDKFSSAPSAKKQTFSYLKNPPEAWQAIYKLLHSKVKTATSSPVLPVLEENGEQENLQRVAEGDGNRSSLPVAVFSEHGVPPPPFGGRKTFGFSTVPFSAETGEESRLLAKRSEKKENLQRKFSSATGKFSSAKKKVPFSPQAPAAKKKATDDFLGTKKPNLTELGRQWFYNRFMNPRSYDLGKQGRISFNKKLGITIASDQLTLTGLDVLYATDYLIKVEKGIYNIDDIDHLKNRRVRTSGELIQIQIGVGLVRLEKFMRYSESNFTENKSISDLTFATDFSNKSIIPSFPLKKNKPLNSIDTASVFGTNQFPTRTPMALQSNPRNLTNSFLPQNSTVKSQFQRKKRLTSSSSIINHKAFNSAIREFFGTSPLSQFMDQINPLAELTHKRRLSSMGPGGVTRDTATLAIRGIHPTHYGRICPIETPEGKNTGLVNSMTTYAMVNSSGILESPFYKVYKGQVQKNAGMYYLNAEQEEQIKLAASDLSVSSIGFLPKAMIPVRIAERFTKISRSSVQYIGVSPLQMISIAASLIPFLEHDDANRALMGSNMQRQAVPLIRPERPIVGTGLEGRTVSDSGHVIQSQYSGLVTYVSAKKIIVS